MGHPISIPILVQYGAIAIPYTFFLLLCAGHLPSRTLSMGHQSFPFLAAFHCTLHLPSPEGCINSHGAPFLPVSLFNNHLWTHGAFTLPIVIFAALLYPTFGTHGHLQFSFDCPFISLVHFMQFQLFLFLDLHTFYLFSLNHVFSRLVFNVFTAWDMKPSHMHYSLCIFPVYHHGALNHPIYICQVGYSFLPTAKYPNLLT